MQNGFGSPGSGSESRRKVHIPMCDVDDLAFKNRHDPNFVASISEKLNFYLYF